MHLPYFLILKKNEIYQLNYICIQSNPRKKITGGFIHKFLANYVSLSVLWDMTLTIYQHICLHSHFTSYKYWESSFGFFFLMMLHCLHFLVYLRGRWFYLCDESNSTCKSHGNEISQSCTNIHICGWTAGCTDQKWGGTLAPVLFSLLRKQVHHGVSCMFVCDSAGILSQHTGDVCVNQIIWLKPKQNQRALANSPRERSQEYCHLFWFQLTVVSVRIMI